MKEHKYDKVLELAQKVSDETKGNALVLIEEDADVGAFAAGTAEGLAEMLRSLMEEQREFADIVVRVAGEYVAGRMTTSLQSKAALRQAYDKTKHKS